MDHSVVTTVGIDFIQDFGIAVGLGLLMGLERERNPSARAGLRTFGLVGLLGTVAALLAEKTGSPWLLAAGLLMVGAMMVAAYLTHPDEKDPGTTSVVALLLCYCYGAMIWYGYQTLAVMLGISTTVLLYFKAELRKVIFSHISEADRLGQQSLDELIEYKTEELNGQIDNARREIERVNGELVRLEEKAAPAYAARIEALLRQKQQELKAHKC